MTGTTHTPGHARPAKTRHWGASSMPLTPSNVTVASRIMLPAYIVHATAFGLLYVTDPQERLQMQPALVVLYMSGLPGLTVWGCLLLCCAATMAAALLLHRRHWFIFALYFYALVNFTWAVIYTSAVFINSAAPFLGGGHVALVGVACFASARSLIKGEVR